MVTDLLAHLFPVVTLLLDDFFLQKKLVTVLLEKNNTHPIATKLLPKKLSETLHFFNFICDISCMSEKSYDELFFTDDFMFSKIMRDPEIAKEVVESLLGLKVGRIKFLTSQFSIDEVYNGRGVRLDAYLEDSDKVVDVEMQTVVRKDEGLRMRYYQSIMDIEHMSAGSNYKSLKESYIVFLCLDDPIGLGKPLYEFVTRERNGDHILNDRTHKLLYNASRFDEVKDHNVRAFLAFLKNRKPSSRLTTKIQSAVDTAKNNQPWRAEYMLWKDQVAEWKEDAREEGLAEGRAEGRLWGIAEYMISEGKSLEQIQEKTGLSEDKIKELMKQS